VPQAKKIKATETVVKVEATEKQHKVLSDPLLRHTAGRLASVMRRPQAERPTQSELDFGFNALVGLKPENTAEVLLCTQMVAVHEVTMEMLTRAKMADHLAQMQEFGALAAKLLSMFERQYTTLMKVRRPQQTVRVEHISVNAGAQAVIGDVNTGAGAIRQKEGQPHATISATAPVLGPGGSMLGENAPGEAVPITGDTEGPLPNARRSGRQRRT
jgi:hypothetical protein